MRPSITAALAEKGHRLTDSRQVVTDLIDGRAGHFTAAELLDEARRRTVKVGRATVFRTVDLLTEMGALERLDLPNGEHAYVVCEPSGHHHHVVCRACGRSADASDAGLQAVVQEIGQRTGFQIESHRLELYGLCPECAREAA